MAIPREATAVHGIGDEDVAEMPDFSHVGARVVSYLVGEEPSEIRPTQPVLCGYNAVNFDVPLLNREFARHGIDHTIDPARVLDPMVWVRACTPVLRTPTSSGVRVGSRKRVSACI